MIVLDANILLYAYDATSVAHRRARRWLQDTFSGGTPVGLPWQSVAAFLRVVTNPNLPGHRYTPEEAAVIDKWLDQPNIRLLTPGERHWPVFCAK